jgi:Domain of unknown function (DUF4263)
MSNKPPREISPPTEVRVKLSTRQENLEKLPESLKAHLKTDKSMLGDSYFVVIEAKDSIKIKENGKLDKCKCYIPALDETVDTINIALTRLSEVFETQRQSHTKKSFKDAFIKIQDSRWKTIGELRLSVGTAFDKLSIVLRDNRRTSTEFESAMSLIRASRKAQEIKANLSGLQKEQKTEELLVQAARFIESLEDILDKWNNRKHDKEAQKEKFWQNLFQSNPVVLFQVFAIPVFIFQEQVYLGGKRISKKGDKIVDFLMLNKVTNNTMIVEIKTPYTKLICKEEYRGDVYCVSRDLSGSVMQVLVYIQSLIDHAQLSRDEEDFEVTKPQGVLIIGDYENDLQDNKKREQCFELFRSSLQGIQILTFDEVFKKIEMLIGLFRSDKS